MLTQNNIDELAELIRTDGKAPIFYIAHNTELREGYIDEFSYKTVPGYRVLELSLTGITNAYWELLEWQAHPEAYHTEAEEAYLDIDTKYVYHYTVRNKQQNYVNEFNPRMPSAIYGTKRMLYRRNVLVGDYNDPSPIKPIFTNVLQYNGLPNDRVMALFDNHELDWKYRELEEPEKLNGAPHKYITSDWFVFDIANFIRSEKHMVCAGQKTAFFMKDYQAFSYLNSMIS